MAQARVPLDAPVCLPRGAWRAMHTLQAGPPSAERYGYEPGSVETAGATEVALIRITGLLAQEADAACGWWDGYGGSTGIVARFTEAATAADVGTVALIFRSPGGTSAGLEEGVRRMCEVRDETGVEVVCYLDEQCGSAAYWIAAALSTGGIFGPVAAFCGSVGSYIPHDDVSEMLAMAGIKETLIADPPGKVAGASSQPLDDVGRARLERDVLACTGRFVNAVATARGLSPDAVRAIDADMLPMADAVAAGLADGIDSLEGVLDLAATLAANPNPVRGLMPQPSSTAPAGARIRHLRPGPRAAAGDPMSAENEAAEAFAPGDRVHVIADDVVGEVTPTECYEVQVDGEDAPRLFRQDELEPEGGAPVAPAGGAQQAARRLPAAMVRTLAHAAGLAPGAGDARAAAAATAYLGLASYAMQLTGTRSPEEARGILAAHARSHRELSGVKATLAARDAGDEAKRRVEVCEQGVTSAVWTPGKVWKDGDKAKGLSAWASAPHKGPAGEDLGQSLAQLEADLRTSVPLAFGGKPAVAAVPGSAVLGEQEQAAARRAGASDEEWEAARASVLSGTLPTKGSTKGKAK
jgi:ClpP class serine protease